MKKRKNTKKRTPHSNVEKIKSIPVKQRSTKYFFKRYKIFEQGKKHPKLITNIIQDEQEKRKYIFMGFTEQQFRGKHKNMPITNPRAGDKRPAYLRKEQREDFVENFENIKNYYLHKEDELKVDEYLNKKRNSHRQE